MKNRNHRGVNNFKCSLHVPSFKFRNMLQLNWGFKDEQQLSIFNYICSKKVLWNMLCVQFKLMSFGCFRRRPSLAFGASNWSVYILQTNIWNFKAWVFSFLIFIFFIKYKVYQMMVIKCKADRLMEALADALSSAPGNSMLVEFTFEVRCSYLLRNCCITFLATVAVYPCNWNRWLDFWCMWNLENQWGDCWLVVFHQKQFCKSQECA